MSSAIRTESLLFSHRSVTPAPSCSKIVTATTSGSKLSVKLPNIPKYLLRLHPKIRGTNAKQPLFKFGDKIGNRWLIKGMIGSGGYGQIYFAQDLHMEETMGVAIKTETKKRKGRTSKRMILEQQVLLRLQGRAHVPKLWGSGTQGKVNYIIMQLLSINISELRKQSPFKRFSRSTMGRIVIQGIAALRDLHQIGYLHRDMKPANMCFGLTECSKHRLLLVDYGLVRKYRRANGKLRKLRSDCGFRGTTVYASLKSHEGKDLGPSDDLISLFYSAIEMIRGTLPWKRLDVSDEIRAEKESILANDFRFITKGIGEGLREFGRAVSCMDTYDEPNYSALQDLMTEFIGDFRLSDPYDWENDYEEVYKERDLNKAFKSEIAHILR